jgi:hypothetical protein
MDVRTHPDAGSAVVNGPVGALTKAGWAWLALGEARPDLFASYLELSLRLGNAGRVRGRALSRSGALEFVLGPGP